jgi:hypothetical protein
MQHYEPPTLTDSDKRLLFNRDFFVSLIKQGYNVIANAEICCHLSCEDKDRSMWIIDILLELIAKASYSGCDPMFDVLQPVLTVQDSLSIWRVQYIIRGAPNSVLEIINYYKARYPKFTLVVIQFLVRLLRDDPLAASYLYSIRDSWWHWLEPYLNDKNFHSSSYGNYVSNDIEMLEAHAEFVNFIQGKLETKHSIDYTKPNPLFQDVKEKP